MHMSAHRPHGTTKKGQKKNPVWWQRIFMEQHTPSTCTFDIVKIALQGIEASKSHDSLGPAVVRPLHTLFSQSRRLAKLTKPFMRPSTVVLPTIPKQ